MSATNRAATNQPPPLTRRNVVTSDTPPAHVRRAAGFFAWSQTETQGADPRLDHAIRTTLETLADSAGAEVNAGRLAVQLALRLQGALLVRHAPPEVADAFCACRLGNEYAVALGTLQAGLALRTNLERTTPTVG